MYKRALSFRSSVLSLSLVVSSSLFSGCPAPPEDPLLNDIAQEWMTLCRNCMAVNQAPTVDARTAFHLSATMYEAWAAYDDEATAYFSGHRLKVAPEERSLPNTHETLSHAAYKLLKHRFKALGDGEKGATGAEVFLALTNKMQSHGYIDGEGEAVPSDAQALGAVIGEIVLEFAAGDGANEENAYADTTGYVSLNAPIFSEESGSNGMEYPNNWAPIVGLGAEQEQSYLTPHWGLVRTFALGEYDSDAPRVPAADLPPFFGTDTEDVFIEEAVEVLRVSGSMDPDVGPGAEPINLSPRVRGIDTPGIIYESQGHAINPYTREPYEDAIVPLGDYLRVLAMYHDGNTFVTPPPWWIEVATDVLSGSGVVSEFAANKPSRFDLGYDVKLYFMVTAAVHDAAVNSWDIKLRYDTSRPISQVRFLDEVGMLPVEEGFLEHIESGDPLAGANDEFVGRYKVMAWAGPDLGVDWIRVADWRPYQPLDFVSPPFPGYNSGHTNMSRAAAEAFTAMTGDTFFPGGLAQVAVDELRFEDDLSTPVTLQWATYQDIADETAFARLCTGVHVRADLTSGRPTGAVAGKAAAALAQEYFEGRGVAVSKRFK